MPANYTIATDTLTEEEILADFKRLVTANTDGTVTEFPDGSFHTAVLEAQAYSYRQVLRYLQYAPIFVITNYLQGVLGLPKREGGRSVTAEITFNNPTSNPIRLYEGLSFRSEIEGNLILQADLLIPAGSTRVQAQLTQGDGVVQVGQFLTTSSILPSATIVITDADPATTATPEIEGWSDYSDRLTNFIAATPQYTPDSISALLRAAGINTTGVSQPSLGGIDVCVLPNDVGAAQTLVSDLTQRFNRVNVVASKPISIYPDKAGGKFTLTELARFNTAGQVARCDQVQGRSVYTVSTPCVPRVERATRYNVGDLVRTGANQYKKVLSDANLVVDPVSAMEAGLGRLVRFDSFQQGNYSAGAGYKSGNNYYIVQAEGYTSSPKSLDQVTVSPLTNNTAYISGQIVVGGSWGIVLNQPVTFPQSPLLGAEVDAPFQPNLGQLLTVGSTIVLFGKYYNVDTEVAAFSYGSPLINLSEIFYHDQLIARPIYTRYGLGVWQGQYWDGVKLQTQPVQGFATKIPINQEIRSAGNSYGLNVQPVFNEIECDVPLALPPCTYFVSP
jgi:hypothetical protein